MISPQDSLVFLIGLPWIGFAAKMPKKVNQVDNDEKTLCAINVCAPLEYHRL